MIRLIPLLVLVTLLSACAPTAAPAATPTLTLIPATATPASTPTATLEPTQSPAQVADSLGLKDTPLYEDRTFTVDGDLLVDEYNGAPKAVKDEDGTWRVLDYNNEKDAETMYGALAPEGEEYIYPNMHYWSDTQYGPVVEQGRVVEARFLGDWEVEPVEYEGQTVHLYHLLAGLRDGGGRLHIVRLAWDAPDAGPEHDVMYSCQTDMSLDEYITPGSGWRMITFFEPVLTGLLPGEVMGFMVPQPTAMESVLHQYYGHTRPASNNMQEVLAKDLYTNNPAAYQMTAGEKAALAEQRWPERTVTLAMPRSFAIRRGTSEDCPSRFSQK